MSRTKERRFTASTLLAAAGLAVVALAMPAGSQEPIKVKISRLGFPSLTTMMVDVVKDQGFDRKHGIDLQPQSFGVISAYYAALATGELDMAPAGPHVLQKMRLEGVPIRAALTYARLNALAVITADASVKSIADLKGKSIAADMGSSEYQIMAIYGRTQGVVFGKDVTVVQAGPPLARSQLQAQRVDAAMTWEPSASPPGWTRPRSRSVTTRSTVRSSAATRRGRRSPRPTAGSSSSPCARSSSRRVPTPSRGCSGCSRTASGSSSRIPTRPIASSSTR